jgi:alkylhydroperoxidase/carboxymuconolactone decarboxylase family protein YurZ
VSGRERLLRRIALGDRELAAQGSRADHAAGPEWLDDRTLSLVRLGALLATDPPGPPLQQGVDEALASDVSRDEIVWALASLIPTIGVTRAASVAPKLGLAIGYDMEEDLERLG